MPFDATGFQPAPRPPKRSKATERVLCVAAMLLAALLLIMPISAAGLIDLARYLSAR